MANMGYCRFENTVGDLEDCRDHITDDLSPSEHNARRRLIKLCAAILDEVGVEVAIEDADPSFMRRADV